MTIRNCSWRMLFIGISIVGILGFAFADYWEYAGLDFWNANRYELEVLQERARSAQLEVVGNDAKSRLFLKSEIAGNIIANRMTLAQATEEYIVLNRMGHNITSIICQRFPAPTLEEATALDVISFAKARLQNCPVDQQKPVLARLEREHEALKTARHH